MDETAQLYAPTNTTLRLFDIALLNFGYKFHIDFYKYYTNEF